MCLLSFFTLSIVLLLLLLLDSLSLHLLFSCSSEFLVCLILGILLIAFSCFQLSPFTPLLAFSLHGLCLHACHVTLGLLNSLLLPLNCFTLGTFLLDSLRRLLGFDSGSLFRLLCCPLLLFLPGIFRCLPFWSDRNLLLHALSFCRRCTLLCLFLHNRLSLNCQIFRGHRSNSSLLFFFVGRFPLSPFLLLLSTQSFLLSLLCTSDGLQLLLLCLFTLCQLPFIPSFLSFLGYHLGCSLCSGELLLQDLKHLRV
mmetsp:Transcript_57929/g.135451  ORF Transcript_57929/g.135451 Transcript_57929/m.135451 type:complete len:254 (-) Transcript_57929:947-1708(-)